MSSEHRELGPTRPSRAGVVADFDYDQGLGTVEEAPGRRHPFHCTAIADGSRRIDVGTQVRFTLLPHHLGELQAGDLIPIR